MTPPQADRPSSRLQLVIATLLVVSLAGAVASGDTGRRPAGGPAVPAIPAASEGSGETLACGLSPTKARAAVDAFEEMMPVLTHPRCRNCHGGVNPYVDSAQGRHKGGAQVDSTDQPLPASECQDCHGELPGWDVPGQGLHFVGKTSKDLCFQFKQHFMRGGASGGVLFVEHLEHEPFSPQFIKAAFLGTRALNTLGEISYEEATGRLPQPEPPPGTLQDLVDKATAWVTEVGQAWDDTPDCGCKLLTPAWLGTVTSELFLRGTPFGTLSEATHATVRFEVDTTSRPTSGRGVVNWKSTGGSVHWNAFSLDACTGRFEGNVPLRGLDDLGDPMAELRLEDVGNGETMYQITVGLWPSPYSPWFTYDCVFDGTPVAMQGTLMNSAWWHYDLENPPVTTDPKRLKGSYQQVHPSGRIVWQWDLHLEP